MKKGKHTELARRLAFAYASYQAGFKSVDRLMKIHADDRIGSYWYELAEKIMSERSPDLAMTADTPPNISNLVH